MHRFVTCHRKECRSAKKRGANNGNWRGGVTKPRKAALTTGEYRAWRRAVFERDNWTCQFCGHRGGGEIHADHIKPWAYFPELRYEVSNGRTLCRDCHRTTFKEVFEWRRKMMAGTALI
jgi:5-methylcytosine-specific restriction endonuclease McrA